MAAPSLDLPCSRLVTYSWDILPTGKSHRRKKLGRSYDDNSATKTVQRFKYATWNIRGLGEKEEELDKTLNEHQIKIAAITESKKKLKGIKETENYTVIYSGVNKNTRVQSGVMIWIHKTLTHKIDHYTYWNDRIIEARLKINRGYLTLFSLYAPVEGREELNDEFYETLQKAFDKVNKNDYILLMGDLNARIRNRGIQNVMGTNGEDILNNNGNKLIDFSTFNQLKIMNTYFRHKNIHKYTWEARGQKSIIDYCISNFKMAKIIQNIRVYRGIELNTDHYLLGVKVEFPPRWLNKKSKNQIATKPDEFYKTNLLNDESTKWLYEQRIKFHMNKIEENSEDIEKEWKNLKQIIQSAAYESLGKIKRKYRRKYLKIWDDEIKDIIEDKKKAHKKWLSSQKLEDKIEYKRKTAIAKREVRKRKRESWSKFVTNLEHDTYKTKPKIYKILKSISNDIKETVNIQGTTDENIFVDYFKKLWNEKTSDNQAEIDTSIDDDRNTNELSYQHDTITQEELDTVLKLLKNGKSPGEDNINSELYKYAPKEFKQRLLKFLNEIYYQQHIPNEWRNAIVIPIYKKGDRKDPRNYRGISILNTCYKIYSKIINIKLQIYSENFMTETQNGFRKGRSCTDPTFCLKLLIEKRREYNLDTFLLFIDYEKAFDCIKREQLFTIMKHRNIPYHLVEVIKDIYKDNKIQLKYNNKLSNAADINRGVRQGCSLSPTLFNIYMNEIITQWQKEVPASIQLSRKAKLNTFLFADDQVIISNTEDNLQKAIFKLNNLITEYGLSISTNKTKTMAFKGLEPLRSKIVINNQIIEQVNIFNYLGSNISYEGEKDINNKLNNFTKITGVINNVFKPKTTLRKTRIKLYNTLALPTLLYGSESWTIKATDASRIRAAEMRYMRKTAGYTWSDYKSNTEVIKELKITPVLEKLENHKTKWIRHVNRMTNDRLPKIMKNYRPLGTRRRGRPMKRLLD